MTKVVIIGDIHGRNTLLQKLLLKVQQNWSWDYIVFLGDYIDRGEDSKGVVDTLLAFQQQFPSQTVFLKGNHEQWLLEAYERPSSTSWLCGMDGFKMMSCYSSELADEFQKQIKALGLAIFNNNESVVLPYHQFFHEVIPQDHLQFFLQLKSYFTIEDLICVHAGIKPGVALDRQVDDDLCWITEDFYANYTEKETVVFGHMNSWQLRDDQQHIPYYGKNNIIGIDACPTGLAALMWPSLDFFVERKDGFCVEGKIECPGK